MKCNNCQAEWTPPPGKSTTSCPFCSEPIQASASDTSSDNIIKVIVQEYSEKILLESRLTSIVADKLKNENPQLLKRIRLAVNENIPKKLYDLKSTSEQERAIKISVIATSLKDDIGMEMEKAYEIVNYFAEALNYKPIIIPKAATPSPVSTQPPESAIKKSQAQSTPTRSNIGILPKIGSIIPFGSYNWRVLYVQNNKALILTENIIEKRAYNNEYIDATWETCTLRKYLNEEFLNKFTSEEQRRIEETRIINSDNLLYRTKGGENTIDKIFILSLEEADKYFGNSSERIAKYGNEACWWWLRSPGGYGTRAARVDYDGRVYVRGDDVRSSGGVRPALWLNL